MSPWVALPQAALGLLCRRCLLWAMVLRRLAPLDLREDVAGYCHKLWQYQPLDILYGHTDPIGRPELGIIPVRQGGGCAQGQSALKAHNA